MEDEKCSNDGISRSPLSGNAPSETLVSNIGGENDTDKSYEDEDGGEIMVEVVGSDILVNGVGGDDLGSVEVDLGENGEEARTENYSDAMERVNEVVNTKEASEAAFAGTRGELNDARDEGVKVSCFESILVEDDGPASPLPSGELCALAGESVNTEVVAVDVPSSAEPLMDLIEEVVEITPLLIREEKIDEVKEVDTDSAILDTSGALKCPVESVAESIVDTSEKEMIIASNNDVESHSHMDEDSLVSQATSVAQGALSEAQGTLSEAPAYAFVGEVCILNPVEEGEVLSNDSPTDGVPKDIAETAAMEDECYEEAELDGGGGASEKEENISSETSNQSLECRVDAGFPNPFASVDDIHLLAKGSLDGGATDYLEPDVHVGCNIHIVDAEDGPKSIIDDCGSSQREEQGVVAQITEPPDHVVVKFGSIEDEAISSDELTKFGETEDVSHDTNGFCIVEGQNSKTELTDQKEEKESESKYREEYSPAVKEDVERSVSLSSETKRQAVDLLENCRNKKVHINAAEVSTPTSETQTPKPSFKIGECIRKVASQLTGFSPSVKGSNDENVNFPAESSSVNEMLSQLQLVAQDPKRGNKLQTSIYAFFFGFVSSIVLNTRERIKSSEQATNGTREEFEFDDVKDSYWTNRVVQNYDEEKFVHNGFNGGAVPVRPLIHPFDPAKSVCKPQSRKRFSTGNYLHNAAATEADETAKRMKQESSPAELILNFAERNCLPSEINLNKTFRRFGPLMESETAVDHESCHARVIFKRGSDAEIACNSAGMFKIFGPIMVNYQIGYSPVISVKIPPLALTQYQQDDNLML